MTREPRGGWRVPQTPREVCVCGGGSRPAGHGSRPRSLARSPFQASREPGGGASISPPQSRKARSLAFPERGGGAERPGRPRRRSSERTETPSGKKKSRPLAPGPGSPSPFGIRPGDPRSSREGAWPRSPFARAAPASRPCERCVRVRRRRGGGRSALSRCQIGKDPARDGSGAGGGRGQKPAGHAQEPRRQQAERQLQLAQLRSRSRSIPPRPEGKFVALAPGRSRAKCASAWGGGGGDGGVPPPTTCRKWGRSRAKGISLGGGDRQTHTHTHTRLPNSPLRGALEASSGSDWKCWGFACFLRDMLAQTSAGTE